MFVVYSSLILGANLPNFHLVLISFVHIYLLVLCLFFDFEPLLLGEKFFHG